MTTVPAPAPPSQQRRGQSAFAHFSDRLFNGVCGGACVLIILLAAALVVVLLAQARPSIIQLGLSFFTHSGWDPVNADGHRVFGALAFIYGTVLTSAIAMLIAVPLGVGTAAYLSEIAPVWLRKTASFLVEMLAAIPSVVYGFWGVFVLAPSLQPLLQWLDTPDQTGKNLLSAGLVLSIMIVPYVTAVSYDVCRAVPKSQREAALALGATRWQMISQAVLPYARPGIIGACFLALGRAIGETMAVTMLIGNKTAVDWSLFSSGNTIASIIASQFREADWELFRSSLIELALVLLLVTVVINALARLLIWRMNTAPRQASARDQAGPWWRAGLSSLRASLARLAPWLALLLPLSFITSSFLQARAHDLEYLPAVLYAMGLPAILVNLTVLTLGYMLLGVLLRLGFQYVALEARRLAGVINSVMTVVLSLCVFITVVPLFVILAYLIYRGVDSLNLSFFTSLPVPSRMRGGGMANALYGSAMLVGLASLFAIPVGLLSAIYMAENRNSRLGSVVRFIGELLGGVPSIVIGIFAYAVVVRPMGHFSGWAGAFALGLIMIPVVMRASEESLKLVPESIRQASYALGASQWQTVGRVILPAALPAIITGVFLAIARIAGETAPLLMTSLSNRFYPRSPSDQVPSVPLFIYDYAMGPVAEQHRQAWAAALVLLMLVMLLNFGVRLLAGKRIMSASRAE